MIYEDYIHSNYEYNLAYVREYLYENEISDIRFKDCAIARAFTKWEDKYVFTLPNGYESFREVFWLEYDEILEMFINTKTSKVIEHPLSYKSKGSALNSYLYFKEVIYPQIEDLYEL